MKKKRLLFILYDRPHYPGGPIVNYLRLLPALVYKGYEVHVLVMYHSDYPNSRVLKNKGIYTHIVPFITDSGQAIEWILKQVKKIQPDVFIPDVSTSGNFAGKWIKASGIPVINSHRSDDDNNWGKAIYFSDAKYGFSSSAIFCVSHYLLEKLKEKVENLDLLTTVIPSGVQIPQDYSQQLNPISIAYVGRLIQNQKRIIETVKVFFALAEKFREISFTFIGDGPDKLLCQEMVLNSPYKNRISFTGMLKDASYKNELAKHNIVILLSDYEGVPGALMDSMASGLVPVCYHYPGVEELIIDGKTGILVEDRQSSTILEAVSYLVSNDILRKQMSLNARQHIVENFSLENSLIKWDILINTLLENNTNQRTVFTLPSEIELPPMNELLKEHVIQPKTTISRQIYKKLLAKTSSFKRFITRDSEYAYDNFINIPFTVSNLDRYFTRISIKNALELALPFLGGRLLDAGCGKMPYQKYILTNSLVSEYVGLDIETALSYDETIKPDYTWDGRSMPFDKDSFDSCIAVEVLEHCPEPEVFLGEVYRVLKPESTFFFTVPFLWNLHEVPNDQYRYTPFALERHLKNSGFTEIQIKAMGGWHASMAQMMGLWVSRAPIYSGLRKLLSFIFKPIMKILIKMDKKSTIVFSESQMITGLYGWAKK